MNNLNILTSLRFWLSIWVILFHHESYFHNLPHSLIVLIHKGHVGVNIFFVLSGFVFGLKYKSIQMKVFLKKRISKLFPTYLIALLINTPFIFYFLFKVKALNIFFLYHFFLNLLLLQSWIPNSISFNAPSWSLSVEFFIYFTFALFYQILSKNSTFKIVLLTHILFSLLYLIFFQNFFEKLPTIPIIHLPSFLIGNYFGKLRNRNIKIVNLYSKFIIAFLLLICSIYYIKDASITLGLISLPIVFFLYYLSFFSITTKCNNLFLKLGEMSYGIYILAFPVENLFRLIFKNYITGYIYLLIYFLFLVLIVLLIEQVSKKFIYANFN